MLTVWFPASQMILPREKRRNSRYVFSTRRQGQVKLDVEGIWAIPRAGKHPYILMGVKGSHKE